MLFLCHIGRILFAIGIAAFGVQYLLQGHYLGGPPPVPPWAPGGTFGAYLVGVFLIVAAIGIAAQWNARLFAALIGTLFLLCLVFLHLQYFSDVIHKGNDRTCALEPLAIAAAANDSPSLTAFARQRPKDEFFLFIPLNAFAVLISLSPLCRPDLRAVENSQEFDRLALKTIDGQIRLSGHDELASPRFSPRPS